MNSSVIHFSDNKNQFMKGERSKSSQQKMTLGENSMHFSKSFIQSKSANSCAYLEIYFSIFFREKLNHKTFMAFQWVQFKKIRNSKHRVFYHVWHIANGINSGTSITYSLVQIKLSQSQRSVHQKKVTTL